jgi:hypothetical protein
VIISSQFGILIHIRVNFALEIPRCGTRLMRFVNNVQKNILSSIIQLINAWKRSVLKGKNGILKRLNAQISVEYVK